MPEPANETELAAYVEAGLALSGLTRAPEDHAPVVAVLMVVLEHAARVQAFPLPDEAEPAPVFEA